MIEIFYRLYVVIFTLFKNLFQLTGIYDVFFMFFRLFIRLIGLHDIEFTNRRIIANEINNPRNHPWMHQPDQNDMN
jgi:hypothetical protein